MEEISFIWQKRVHFFLTAFQVVYVLTTPKPLIINSKEETLEDIRKRQKWENGTEICHGHILNTMSDSLIDIYHSITTAKELWNLLELKYDRLSGLCNNKNLLS